jgi:Bacterial Ig-like domain (group 2)
MATLVMICGYLICGLVGLLGVAVLWQVFDGTIDLSRLISEPNGDASMSRFQFLVFTFVIALSLFLVIVAGKNGDGKPAFPESIPGGILTLLGISGSSYAVGKAIQFSDPAGVEDRPVTITISPTDATVHYGQTQQFTATVARKPDAKVRWEVTPGRGTVNPDTGLYRAPNAPAPAQAAAPGQPAPVPATPQHATIKATCVDYPDVSDVSVITLA